MEEYPFLKLAAQQSGNFTRAEGQAVMESWLKSLDKIDVLIAQNDDMALGAVDAIKAAGLVPGKDIIIVGCDSVKAAFDAIVAGDMNCTVECTPLYGPTVESFIERIEAGETFSKEIVHPEEFVYDMDGGIALDDTVSIKAADVIDSRQYYSDVKFLKLPARGASKYRADETKRKTLFRPVFLIRRAPWQVIIFSK